MKNRQENLATLTISSHNVTTSTREPTTCAWISADIWRQDDTIGHVRYINIQAWLRGFRVKIAIFSSFFCPSIPKRDFDTKKTTPNMDVRPESLGAMLEYWYIERGLFVLKVEKLSHIMGPRASHRTYGLHPWLWLLLCTNIVCTMCPLCV